MRKIVSLLLTLCLCLSSLAALAAQEPVTLSFACWGSVEESTRPAFEAMVAAFEAKYPHIKVEMTGYPYNDVQSQLLIQAAGGTPPDVAQCAPIWVASLAEMDALCSMDELFDEAAMGDYYPGACSGTTIGGKRMSIPWNINPVCLFYNKALLAKAGYDHAPATWGEMVEMSRAVAALGNNEDGNKLYGMTLSTKLLFGAGYFFLLNVWQHGGEFVDESGNVVLNSPQTVAAFEEARDLIAEGVVAGGLEVKENRNLFALGQAAFHLDLPSIVKLMADTSPKGQAFLEDFAIAQCPGQDGPEGISFSSDHHMVVFKDSPHREEAALFVDFITGAEGMKIYTDNGVTVLPARASVEGNDFYKTLDDKAGVFFKVLPVTRGLPVQSSSFIQACEAIITGVQRVCINGEDAAAVVAETDAAIKGLYGQ